MSFLDDTAIIGAALVAILTSGGAFAARAWHGIRETGRKTDLQNKLLFGDGTDENPGLGKYMTKTTTRLNDLDAGQLEMLDRVARVEKKITLNGGASDDLGDIAKRVEEEVRRIGRMVATGDGMTLGQMASNDETRRIAHMEPKDRTVRENEHFDTAPDREQP